MAKKTSVVRNHLQTHHKLIPELTVWSGETKRKIVSGQLDAKKVPFPETARMNFKTAFFPFFLLTMQRERRLTRARK